MTMSAVQLLFVPTQLKMEVQDFVAMSRRSFLGTGSDMLLTAFANAMDGVARGAIGSSFVWEIQIERPVRTATSQGDYESPGKTGGSCIYATMSCKWSFTRQRVNGHGGLLLRLEDAITQISLYAETANGPNRLGVWNFEIGTITSPGCYFHTKVEGSGSGWFPNALPVPRLHSLPLSPVATLEYVIAELFQGKWYSATSGRKQTIERWSSIQRNRFERFFEAMSDALEDLQSTPLLAIKSWKPSDEKLFL